ncbi:lysis protein [Pseudomonas aeruginosa]|uniref:lysis protein n=1 Tax=Pseudomonas aeruginosa TaxID=287 RepID=UPI001E5F943E|nr:lysis protein [Pseudomonas aeruginosa]MCD2761383.1 lysis protein [Pseudomonas aeruginosa]HBP0991501.1 lysis protein [Pseudomonas aeruginosa]HBP1202096.1 lysis protein [Pseudomonas aeruginosa]
MRKVIGWLIEHWYFTLFAVLLFQMWSYGQNQYDLGHRTAKAEGDEALAALHLEHQTLRADAAEQNLVLYRQQVERANQAELVFLDAQDEIGRLKQQLTQERIARVSTQYTPARGAAPVAAPRFVVTCGWLRDFNAALGATAPAPPSCRANAGSEEAAWAAPGSDAELLESGVVAADILAHARDYGAWALANLAQLNALIDLHDKDKR